jgi:D-glycero-alpha-D-manno-heptose-7-phosphate kinase
VKTVSTRAPTRIDLAGGTLDIPPLYLFHDPAVTVNVAIDVGARVTITSSKRLVIVSHDQNEILAWDSPQLIAWGEHSGMELILRLVRSFRLGENLRVEVRSEVPAGSGLGGSSAIAIALTRALAEWCEVNLSSEELVDWAKSIETQTIKVPTGYQDYWGAVYGSVHAYEMGLNGKVKAAPLGSAAFHRELERHLLLVYTGRPRFSGTNNWELFKRHIDGEAATVEFFERLKENALHMRAALEGEDIGRTAEALNRDWRTRKAMLPTMTTAEIERVIEEGSRHGMLGARVCGAGGGGCLTLLVDPARRDGLVRWLQEAKLEILPVRISETGVLVERNAATARE